MIPTPLGGASVDWERAVDLFHQGHELQLSDRLQEAVGAYQRSIAAFPTFEAHIYLGWTYSWMGAYELAIVEAKRAIELGPDYGNAYNDIGAYLIAVDQLDEAIPWLRKAMNAKRYVSPHFPHLNLGAIWVRKELWEEALKAYEDAIRLVPEQPLRPLPTLVIPASALTEEIARPWDEERLQAISDAMRGYFEAWNAYDPVALLDRSAPPTVSVVSDLLLNLADAKLQQSKTRLLNTELIYLSERMAIMGTVLQIAQSTGRVPYLLLEGDGIWKVVGLAVIAPAEARDELN